MHRGARSTCETAAGEEENRRARSRREKWTGHYEAEIEGRGARYVGNCRELDRAAKERSGPPASRQKCDKNRRKMELAEFLIFEECTRPALGKYRLCASPSNSKYFIFQEHKSCCGYKMYRHIPLFSNEAFFLSKYANIFCRRSIYF